MMNTPIETCGPLCGMNLRRSVAAFAIVVFSVALVVAGAPVKDAGRTAAGHAAEGKLESFLGEPKLDIQQVHRGGRFPNILVSVDGTVLALWGGVKVRRSEDGGETWTGWRIVEALPDGPQDTNYGCMAGLVRLPVRGRDILIYSNCDSPGGRKLGTVWASFDGGKTWPLKRLVHAGSFAYSALAAGRPATRSQGWIYLHFESGGSKVARFNLSWLLEGEETGDGELPSWLAK